MRASHWNQAAGASFWCATQAVLYESDLDDNGVSQCSVKLRVMPRAWLVLLRFFLRVDGSMVRLRETRLFCRYAAMLGPLG